MDGGPLPVLEERLRLVGGTDPIGETRHDQAPLLRHLGRVGERRVGSPDLIEDLLGESQSLPGQAFLFREIPAHHRREGDQGNHGDRTAEP